MSRKKIFICYRRSDSEAVSGALARQLREHFGKQSVFRDKDNIEGGERWIDQLEQEISKDSALFVLIGKDWVGQRSAEQGRRIDDPDDIVRKEIRLALEKKAQPIPILLEDVQMPTQLPEDISGLADYQAWRLRDDSWDNDFRRIVEKLKHTGHGTRRSRLLIGMACGVAILIVGAALLSRIDLQRASPTGCLGDPNNLLKNCGFEEDSKFWGTGYVENELHPGQLNPFWESWIRGARPGETRVAQVVGEIDRKVRRSGTQSFGITNNSPRDQHIYGSMSQRISGLERHADYVAMFWVKADGAKSGTLIVTTDLKWLQRKLIDAGTYDWKPFSHVFNTGDNDFVDFRLISEEPGEIWLDDITFKRLPR